MPEIFAPARAWLVANIDPAAPAALLVIIVFLAVYSLRRWAPSLWLRLEHAVPFVDSIDPAPGLKILLKVWQALPGAAFGAATAALTTGLSVTHALWGVVAGFAASAVHEIMAAYQGAVGRPKPPTSASGSGRGSITIDPPKPFPPPPAPPAAAMRALPIGFFACLMLGCVSLSGCAWFKGSFWPKVENCAPSPASLVAQVGDILAAGGDYESALEQLALTDTKAAVVCAVEAFVSSLGANDGAHADAQARGKAFLAKVAAQ